MGRKAREIISVDLRDVMRDLSQAYALEWVAHHLFYTYAQIIRGLDSHIFQEEFKKASEEELKHAGRLAKRIVILGGEVPASLDDIVRLCPFKLPKPPESPTDYRGFVESILKLEREAIMLYDSMMKRYRDSDHLTYELAEDLLAEELAEEELWERVLVGL